MAWKQRTANQLVNLAEEKKEGKCAPGFAREWRSAELGDLVTLLSAGGKLVGYNIDTGMEYEHRVVYEGYGFLGRTPRTLPDGILNRKEYKKKRKY